MAVDPSSLPILWSFRRCPYAIRARLALQASGQTVALREVVLRDKPDAFLAVSPSATVPCLQTADAVIDESLDIMLWALRRNDPLGWLDMPTEGMALIARNDGPFKQALDRTKYAVRYPDSDPSEQRAAASQFLHYLDDRLTHDWLFGRQSLADMAILPFVRQFASIDRPLFDAQPWPRLRRWLDRFAASIEFTSVMTRHQPWRPAQAPIIFPA